MYMYIIVKIRTPLNNNIYDTFMLCSTSVVGTYCTKWQPDVPTLLQLYIIFVVKWKKVEENILKRNAAKLIFQARDD